MKLATLDHAINLAVAARAFPCLSAAAVTVTHRAARRAGERDAAVMARYTSAYIALSLAPGAPSLYRQRHYMRAFLGVPAEFRRE